ncbi:MAG: YfhO family protein, partial [Lachnospiraceae bacterium]|nr:YfhO family protein [Lachnospiraceae bacterium]
IRFSNIITCLKSKNKLHIVTFGIPFFTMLVLFAISKIYPFGDRSFLNIDMYHQYFQFLTEFFHKLKEGEAGFYSWNAGIGSNFIALYAYYLASPINWLCILVPEAYLMEFMSYLVIVKIGLCGLTAGIYLSRHFQTKHAVIASFSTFYAMSGYMAAYNWNVMWLDCIVLAPLILLGLECLVKEGKYKLYCISLGIAILSNYYICIMICIFLVLYFLIVLLPLAEKKIKACLYFFTFSLLAGGMGALFLIPEVFALRLSRFSSADFPDTLKSYFSVFDVLARHCMNVEIETGLDHWPNIYCSVAVMVLFPLYIANRKIAVKEKIGKLVLLFVMLVSFSYNIPTFIWHGMNYPDSLPARQSFLYILLLLTVCMDAFLHIK